MILGGRSYKTVFLFGAGASRGALRHVLINRKRVKPPLNADFFAVAETYARAKGRSSADKKRLDRLKRVFTEEIPVKGFPTMEEAFSLLYITKDFPEIYKTGPGRKPSAGTRREIEDFLRLTFDILAVLDRNSREETGYDRLVAQLGLHDAFVSLNYDTLLDSALVRRGWKPKTGYRLGGGKRKVEWEPHQQDESRPLAGIPLLKLHGSINWFVRGSYGSLSKVFASKPVRVSGPRRNEIAHHIRQIVPPIYGKIFDHGHWRTLWTQAFQELCTAEVLVVIGCSLIDTDFHLRALIGRVVKHRKEVNQPFKRTILVAGTKTRRKWQTTLKGSYRMTAGYPTFEKFLRKELKV
jgi:SIR2-like domain